MKLLHAHSPSRSPPWSSRLRPRPPTLCVARLWTTRPRLALDCFSVLSRAVVGTRPRVPARLRLQRRRPTPRLPPAMLRITWLPQQRCVREVRRALCTLLVDCCFWGGGLRHSDAHREPFLPPLPPDVVDIYLATRGRRPPGPHEARAVAAWAFCGLCRLAYTLPSLETRETAAQAFCALCLGAYSSPSLEARETAAQAFCSLGRGAYSPPLPSRDAIDGGAGIPRHVPWSVFPPRPSRGVIDGGAGVLWPGARGVLPPSLSGCGRWRRRRSAAWSVGRTIPRPSWGPGDGGAGDVRPEPRGVLPPFPLAVQSTAAQAICSLNRGRTPPLTFIGCGRWRRGFYSRGRGAYSPPFPSGCG